MGDSEDGDDDVERTDAVVRFAPGVGHRPHLFVFGEEGSQVFPLPENGRVTIGRGEQVDVRVKRDSLSRVHAALHVASAGEGTFKVAIEDLGSANGTTVGGRALSTGEVCAISLGVTFDLGTVLMMVQATPSASTARPRRLWQHGEFESKLEEECERAEATQRGFGLIRARVRRDDASKLEEVLSRVLRSFDAVAQYAPGEYEVLVVDGTPASMAKLTAQIDAEIARVGAKLNIGVACHPTDGKSAAELSELSADRARGIKVRPKRGDSELVVPTGGPMASLSRLADRVARSDISVLILGETGVGKEVLAERIHKGSLRASGPYVRLNCAALAPSLLESELFGYERGAFTGAAEAKAGLLETAQGGTIFLDEVGEMSTAIQVKLLRVLEEREVMRVGGLKTRAIDVRFIAATNRDLEAEIDAGTFRRDFYYRLNGVTLVVPPLRERKDEIEALALTFARKTMRACGFEHEPVFTKEALGLLHQYYWPGNIRELRNLVDRAVIISDGAPMGIEHLPLDKLTAPVLGSGSVAPASVAPVDADADRKAILDALDACAGNQTRAAKMLGIARSTLVARLDSYGIARPRKKD